MHILPLPISMRQDIADIDAVGAINSVIKLSIDANVLFDVAKSELIEEAKYTLDSVAGVIHQIDKATILVEGHTDSDGGVHYNQRLSERRCLAVEKQMKLLLANLGSYDYDITGYGEHKPVAPNDTKESKKLNRRVEITVLPPKEYFESLDQKNQVFCFFFFAAGNNTLLRMRRYPGEFGCNANSVLGSPTLCW